MIVLKLLQCVWTFDVGGETETDNGKSCLKDNECKSRFLFSVLQHVAACCDVLQCVAVWYIVMYCIDLPKYVCKITNANAGF